MQSNCSCNWLLTLNDIATDWSHDLDHMTQLDYSYWRLYYKTLDVIFEIRTLLYLKGRRRCIKTYICLVTTWFDSGGKLIDFNRPIRRYEKGIPSFVKSVQLVTDKLCYFDIYIIFDFAWDSLAWMSVFAVNTRIIMFFLKNQVSLCYH